MKNILAALVLITSFSCSTESGNTDNNSPQNIVSKIRTTSFVFGEPEVINNRIYENNRPQIDSVYSVSNDTWIYIKHFYENDKLVLREVMNSQEEIVEELTIGYDELGRISHTSNITNLSTSNVHFTYTNQTITSENNTDGEITTKVFHLNSDGIIYKEVSSMETIEIQYDLDYNVISFESSTMPTITYTYDNNVLPPINLQFFDNFMFGEYKNNVILCKNNIGRATFRDIAIIPKYHLSVNNINSQTHTFEWALDENNYPISRKTYDENNHLIVKFDYFYN